ncbi:MAG: restriction endonuclease subunit S [Proteobacteria bacterium]|nr:restriction endonuclease subunit S [Pseudomonadota bacterium]
MSLDLKHLDTESLPTEWTAELFGNIVDFKLGKTPPRAGSIYWKNGKYPWVSISDMTPHGVVMKTAEKVSQEAYDKIFRGQLVPEGSLLMSFKLTIGRVSQLGIPAFHNEAIISFRPDCESVNYDFLRYYLSQINYKDYQDTAIKGQTLNKGKLKSLEIALPPLLEQKKIAHILSMVQRAIETQERIIQITTELKKALMQKLFTEGLHNEPQKQTEIGLIPESWEVVELGTIFQKEPQNGIYKHKREYGTGTQILRIDDFGNDGDVVTKARNLVRLSSNEIDSYGLEAGDIVINRVNSLSHLGKTALIGEIRSEMVFESNMMRFSVDEAKVRKQYVFKFLNSPVTKKQIVGTAKRAVAQSSINQGDVKSILVPKPSLVEQEEIAGALEAIESKIATAGRKTAALQELFRTLLHELMTAKTRVHDLEIPRLELAAN